jgi:hypothetical protein
MDLDYEQFKPGMNEQYDKKKKEEASTKEKS